MTAAFSLAMLSGFAALAQCAADVDCSGNRICIDGECAIPCGRDTDCPGEALCEDGRCVGADAQAKPPPAPPPDGRQVAAFPTAAIRDEPAPPGQGLESSPSDEPGLSNPDMYVAGLVFCGLGGAATIAGVAVTLAGSERAGFRGVHNDFTAPVAVSYGVAGALLVGGIVMAVLGGETAGHEPGEASSQTRRRGAAVHVFPVLGPSGGGVLAAF